MKSKYLLITVIILVLISGCQNKSVRLNIENADDIVISYGVSSYMMFGAAPDIIRKLVDNINELTFKPTKQEMDFLSTYRISFYSKNNKEPVAQLSVDKNGILWLNGTTDTYIVSSGDLDYDLIESVYLESKDNKASKITSETPEIEYYDATEYNSGDKVKKKVEITYIQGHTSDSTLISFNELKPYDEIKFYLIDQILVILYDEVSEGESKDRLFSVKGLQGEVNSDKIEVYINGKRIYDIQVSNAVE